MFLFCSFFEVYIFVTRTVISGVSAHILERNFFSFLFRFSAAFCRCGCLQSYFFHDSGFSLRRHHAYILNAVIVIFIIHCSGCRFRQFFGNDTCVSCTTGNITSRIAFLLGSSGNFIDFIAYLLHSCFSYFFHIFPSLRAACAVSTCFCIIIIFTHQGMCLHQNINHFLGQVCVQIFIITFICFVHAFGSICVFKSFITHDSNLRTKISQSIKIYNFT